MSLKYDCVLPVLSLTCLLAGPVAAAEFQLSVYGGLLDAGSSRVSGTDATGAGGFNFDAGWDGKSDLPSFGIRGTWWQNETVGYALDFKKIKLGANATTITSSGFPQLNFDDGISTVTVNAMKRFPQESRWTPYVGGGVGVAIPQVDIQTSGTGQTTTEYQYGGVVAQFQGGVEFELNDSWSLFGEYQMNVIDLDVDLSGGGNLSTGVVTNSVSVGAGFSF